MLRAETCSAQRSRSGGRLTDVPDVRRRLRFVAVLTTSLLWAIEANADISACLGPGTDALCPLGTTVCQVDKSKTVANNAVLDCGDNVDLVIANGLGKLTVNGNMTI